MKFKQFEIVMSTAGRDMGNIYIVKEIVDSNKGKYKIKLTFFNKTYKHKISLYSSLKKYHQDSVVPCTIFLAASRRAILIALARSVSKSAC